MEPLSPKFGRVSGYAYTINSVIGAGFLSIPWAFQNLGWVLALGMQVVFILIGGLLSDQLLEITSRVEAIKQYKDLGGSVPFVSIFNILRIGFSPKTFAAAPLLDLPSPQLSETRQYDLSEIVKTLMGPWWGYAYLICISLFLAGTLSAYINIFGTAFGTNVPLFADCDFSHSTDVGRVCQEQYWMYVGIFFVIMVYFTCIEFSEGLWMQLIMTAMRMVVMSAIIVTCLASLMSTTNMTNDHGYQRGHPPIGSFDYIGQTFPIFMFAAIYQTQYPSILSAIRKDKNVLTCNLIAVTLTLILFYSVMGLTASFAIPNVSSNVSLSFANYSAGYSLESRPDWSVGLSYLIVLFPAIDVISIFPIIGHAISDNVLSMIYGAERDSVRADHKIVYYGLRVGCIFPSFCYAFFQIRFGFIVSNSGLFCFFLTFFMIPLLQITSRYLVRKPSLYAIRNTPLVTFTQWLSAVISVLSVPLLMLNILSLIVSS